jgi:type II secretory pathway component PulF
MEKPVKTNKQIKSATVYSVVAVVLAIVALLMVLAEPSFHKIYRDMLKGEKLPWLTQDVINVSTFMQGHLLLTADIVAVVFLLMGYCFLRNRE